MPFPAGWPPRKPSNVRTLRFRQTGTTSANWDDNAYLFAAGGNADAGTANPFTATPYIRPGDTTTVVNVTTPMGGGRQAADAFPLSSTGTSVPMVWSTTIYIRNTGASPLEFSFSADDNGDNEIHGVVPANTTREFRDRIEAGIALRTPGGTTTFEVEAW